MKHFDSDSDSDEDRRISEAAISAQTILANSALRIQDQTDVKETEKEAIAANSDSDDLPHNEELTRSKKRKSSKKRRKKSHEASEPSSAKLPSDESSVKHGLEVARVHSKKKKKRKEVKE